jgi:uncharacterized protein
LTSTAASSPDRAGHTPGPVRRSAPAVAPRDHLLISIHDVTPALEPRVLALWKLCRERGVTPALLVVPNWHGVAPLDRAPDFVQWLRGCAEAGAELFLHGERHDEAGSPRGWRDAWRAWGATAREGEFLTLDEAAARERIDRGLDLFARLGLTAIGFVPPAWLARPGCWRAVGAAGLRYAEDAGSVLVHRADAPPARIPSPVVRWSSRASWRAQGSAAVAAARWRFQRRAPYVRLALHPSDLDHPTTARSATMALDRWLTDRDATRYTDL